MTIKLIPLDPKKIIRRVLVKTEIGITEGVKSMYNLVVELKFEVLETTKKS